MARCIALIHNSKIIIDEVEEIFSRVYPKAKLVNIMDESLLRDIKERGGINKLGVRRICRYALCAEDMGADGVLMTCSSLCDAVFTSRAMINIPAFAINEPMTEEAVSLGNNIVVIGTLQSVLKPTVHLIESKAKIALKEVKVKSVLCSAAFEAIASGDQKKHDELLLTELIKVANDGDVIVFAQGSMSRLVPEAKNRVAVPILECIESGIKQVRDFFES